MSTAEFVIIAYLLGIGWESASFFYAVFCIQDDPMSASVYGGIKINGWNALFTWIFWPVRVIAYVAYVIFGR